MTAACRHTESASIRRGLMGNWDLWCCCTFGGICAPQKVLQVMHAIAGWRRHADGGTRARNCRTERSRLCLATTKARVLRMFVAVYRTTAPSMPVITAVRRHRNLHVHARPSVHKLVHAQAHMSGQEGIRARQYMHSCTCVHACAWTAIVQVHELISHAVLSACPCGTCHARPCMRL